MLPEDGIAHKTSDSEHTPLKGAAIDPQTNRADSESFSQPPPPYAAINIPESSSYSGQPRYTITPGPPIAPIQGIPTPQSYSPIQPFPSHPGAVLHTSPQLASRRAINRFLKAYLIALACVLVWGLVIGTEITLHDHPNHPGPYIRAKFMDIVSPGSRLARQSKAQRNLPECRTVPPSPIDVSPPGSAQNPYLPAHLPPLERIPVSTEEESLAQLS